MPTKTKKKKKTTFPKVHQSELGLFIKLIHEDTPVEDIKSKEELATRISAEFNVTCTEEDIITFYNLDVIDEDLEREDRFAKAYGSPERHGY
jgi:hypothetical protein